MSGDGRPRLHPILGTPLIVLVGALGAVVAAIVLVAIAAGALKLTGDGSDPLTWAQHRPLLGLVVTWLFAAPALIIFGQWMTGLRPAAMGLHRTGSSRLFVLGTVIGVSTLMAPALAGRALGWIEPTTSTASLTGAVALGGVLFALPALAIAAFGEELAFRGVLLPYWQRAAGGPTALIVTAVLFVALHGMNPNASVLGWVGIFLAGIWLGVAFQVTQSLWFATGLHLGWNVATSLILGFRVSGFELPALLRWQTVDDPLAQRLLGGSFGPEEGIAFHLSLTVSIVVVLVVGATARPAGASTEGPASPPSHPPRPGTPQ